MMGVKPFQGVKNSEVIGKLENGLEQRDRVCNNVVRDTKRASADVAAR